MATSECLPTTMDDEPSNVPFRLLDLPQELQDKIYATNVGIYDIELWGCKFDEFLFRPTSDCSALKQTCRKVLEDVRKIEQKSYSGNLKVFIEGYKSDMLAGVTKLGRPDSRTYRYAQQTTDVQIKDTICYSTFREHSIVDVEHWTQALSALPHLAKLRLNHNSSHFPGQYSDDYVPRRAFRDGTETALLDGQFDETLANGIHCIGLQYILRKVSVGKGNIDVHFKHVQSLILNDELQVRMVSADTVLIESADGGSSLTTISSLMVGRPQVEVYSV